MVKGPARDHSSRQRSRGLWTRFVQKLTRTNQSPSRGKKPLAKKEDSFDPPLRFFKDGDELEEYCKNLHW